MARNRRKRWDFRGFGANLMPNAEGHLGNVGLCAEHGAEVELIKVTAPHCE
jgi:hypothetical protein